MSGERQSRLMKTVAAAMGADISDIEPDESGYDINGRNDLGFLPINVGYDIME